MQLALLLLVLVSVPVLQGQNNCAPCHNAIIAKYAQTGMGRSIAAPVTPSGRFDHKRSGSHLSAISYKGRMYHEVERGGIRAGYPVAFAIGSGNVGQSFAVRAGKWLVQSPLSWFAQSARWGISPGFDLDVSPDFDRRIGSECLNCHTAAVQQETSLPQPISCERCHPASATHFASPASMAPAQRDGICEACHLQGEARILNPGSSWDESRPSFTTYVSTLLARDLKVVSQVEQFAASECARQSNGKFWCGSCHSPHGIDKPAREVCTGCHAGKLSAFAHPNRAALDCASCHMPRRATPEVAHTAYTDHRIRRSPQNDERRPGESKPELRAWTEPTEQYRGRNLGLAYVYAGQRLQSADWIQKGFGMLLDLGVQDAEVLAALGSVLLQKQRPQDALAMFSKAATLHPGSVEHRHNAAVALFAAGDTDRALERLQQAVGLDPYYERSWLLIVQIYRQTGRPELARQTMERYIKHVPQSLTFRAALNKSVSR